MKKLLIIFLLFIGKLTYSQSAYEIIMSRVFKDETLGDLATIDNRALTRLNTISEQGTWPVERPKHLPCVMDMARAYTKAGSAYEGNQQMYDAIVLSLKSWSNTSISNLFWYDRDITCATDLGKVLILMRYGSKRIPEDLEKKLIEKIKADAFKKGDGSNTTEEAVPYIFKGCLGANPDQTEFGVYYAFEALAYDKGSLRSDNSFSQHGNQLYINGYGRKMLSVSYSTARLLVGTPYALSGEKLNILNKFYHDTYLKAGKGSHNDWTSYGRGFVRGNGVVHNRVTGINTEFLSDARIVDSANPIWDQIARGTYQSQPKHNRYWITDFDLHIRPGYTFSLRTISTRSIRLERSEDENFLAKFMTDGSTNIQRIGSEYQNIFPIWEYDKIPGTTTRDFSSDDGSRINVSWGKNTQGITSFVGGVTDSLYGVTAYDMDYDQVRSKKSWFFFDNEVVCMGAGVSSSAAEKVTTTVNQCWLFGDIQVGSSAGNSTISNASNTITNAVAPKWVLHDSVGYFFPSGGNLQISNRTQSGNWRRVGTSVRQVNAALQGQVFKMWFDHGAQPLAQKYEYVVVPNIGIGAMNNYKISNINILKNTDSIQAVRHLGLDMLQVVFYKKGKLVDGDISIAVDLPCVVMVKNVSSSKPILSITDPARLVKTIEVAFKFPAIPGRERTLVATLSDPAGKTTRYELSDKIEETPIKLITPIADSFVENSTSQSTINYGNESFLKIANSAAGPAREIFLKFDTRVLSRQIQESYVKLRVFLSNAKAKVSVSDLELYTTSNNWSETQINWKNKPVLQTAISTQQKLSDKGYIDWDITKIINELSPDSVLSFKLVMKDAAVESNLQFESKESELKPQIVIEEPLTVLISVGSIADTYVSSGEINRNFGTSDLLVSRRTVNDIFLKFDLSNLKGKIVDAKLKLKRANTSRNAMTLYEVGSNTWAETDITFNNSPMPTSEPGIYVNSPDALIYFDVTNLMNKVTKEKLISFKLSSGTNTLNNTFFSKEATGDNSNSGPVIECVLDTTWYVAPRPIVENLSPIADAYVSSRPAEVNQNFGKSIRLYVKPGMHDSFLKFDLNRSHGKILNAKLKLSRVVSFDNASEIQLFAVGDDSWTEDGINFNNRPTAAQMLASSNNSKQAISFDVTSLIQESAEDGLLSLKLYAPAGALTAYLHSNQATDPKLRPVLECVVDTTQFDGPKTLAKADIQAIKLRLANINGSVDEKLYTASDIEPSNLITPNGDNRNDTWLIKNIGNFNENAVKVYGINGLLIYSKKGYDNSWNATYNGAQLPDGAYVYIIDKGDQSPLIKGVLNVISSFK